MRFTALPVHSFEDATLDLEQLQALLTLPAWTAPTLINAWVNAGGSNSPAGYLKDSLGFVHLRGAISGGATNTAAFVLPVGYRPVGVEIAPTVDASGVTPSYVTVKADGTVIVTTSGNTYQSLLIPPFRAEN